MSGFRAAMLTITPHGLFKRAYAPVGGLIAHYDGCPEAPDRAAKSGNSTWIAFHQTCVLAGPSLAIQALCCLVSVRNSDDEPRIYPGAHWPRAALREGLPAGPQRSVHTAHQQKTSGLQGCTGGFLWEYLPRDLSVPKRVMLCCKTKDWDNVTRMHWSGPAQ